MPYNATLLCHNSHPRSTKYGSRLLIPPRIDSEGPIGHENLQTFALKIIVQSAGVSLQNQIFYTNEDDETEEQYWRGKKQLVEIPPQHKQLK